MPSPGIAHPWLPERGCSQVIGSRKCRALGRSSVVRRWVNENFAENTGLESSTVESTIVGDAADPGCHLPVTFPADLSQVPASMPAQFPGVTGHDLSYWNDAANGWVVPDGQFGAFVGDSSALANLPLRGDFTVVRSVGLATPRSRLPGPWQRELPRR